MLIENCGELVAVTAYILVGILLLPSMQTSSSVVGGKLVGQSCVYHGGSGKLRLEGECRNINQCDAAVSNLWAGLSPQPCRPKEDLRVVCCPKEQRISEKKCNEYQEVLKSPVGPLPLLPLYILRSQLFAVENEVNCGPPRPDAFIVNGESAIDGEFPHMAALGYGDEKDARWYCGGTLISEDFVLTAAHCIEHPEFGFAKRVMLGALKLSQDTNGTDGKKSENLKVIDVETHFIHPKYKAPKVYNDIALLKLKSPVKVTRNIRPACLPQAEHRPEKTVMTTVIGWGRTELGGEQSDTLQKVALTRTSQKECERLFNDLPYRGTSYPQGILRTQFCAGSTTEGKDSCQGDSGGPLTITREGKTCVFYLTGVVSFGEACGIKPGIYTNVQSFLDWIEEIVWPHRS